MDLGAGYLAKAHGLGAEGFAEMLIDVVVVAHARPGETDELPADHIDVAAMDRVGEHALDRVLPQEFEEQGRFDLPEHLVLVFWIETIKAFQVLQSITINLAWRGFALIAEFPWSIFKGTLRVTKAVASVGAGKLTVDVDGDAGFACTRAGVVASERCVL